MKRNRNTDSSQHGGEQKGAGRRGREEGETWMRVGDQESRMWEKERVRERMKERKRGETGREGGRQN